MDREFYVYGNSHDCFEIHPKNEAANFRIHLSKPIHLEGQWEVGLMQFQFDASTDKPYHVCCDLVCESYVGDHKLPILRRVRLKHIQFTNVLYVPLKIRDFQDICIYLVTWKNKEAHNIRGRTFCTLHFRRRA